VSTAAVVPSGTLFTVEEAAKFLGASQCWIRRHETELPTVRVGRFLRFDSSLLSVTTGKPIRSSNGFVIVLLLTSQTVTRSDIERTTKWT
jgi:hypothetical protein